MDDKHNTFKFMSRNLMQLIESPFLLCRYLLKKSMKFQCIYNTKLSVQLIGNIILLLFHSNIHFIILMNSLMMFIYGFE